MYPPSGQSSPVSLFGHPGHEVQFYSNDELLVDGMYSYLRGSLQDGNGAFCVATKQHLAALAMRLEMRNHDMTAAAEQGRYVALDVNDVVSAVTIEGKLNEARAAEFFGTIVASITNSIKIQKPHVVFFGETSASLWAGGNIDDVLRLEELGNELAREKSISMLCPYSTRAFQPGDSESLRTICAEHAAIIAPEGYAPWAEEMPAEIPSDRLLSQEQQLFESDAKLSYPDWQGDYRAAVLEMDLTRLFKNVEVAQASVLTKLHELQRETDSYPERHQLMQAWRVLQIIKKEKLGFIE